METLPERPLRVAIVSPTFGGYGGMEAFACAVASGLPLGTGLEVRLYLKRVAAFALRPSLEAALVSLGGRVWFVGRASAALFRALAWADVVHAQNPSPDVVLLSRLLRKPLLITVHNRRLPGGGVRARLWRSCLRLANRRFYVSNYVRRSWEGEKSWPDSEVVFPICELASDPKPPAARRGFAFAARWIPNKGVDTLVEAYAGSGLDPDIWPLRLIGDGPLRPRIELRIREAGIRGVEILGFISQAAKVEAIRSARWMVVPPNTNEDFGLTAIEARHLHVPCVITRDGGLPEAAGGEALVCAPGDVAGLTECLRIAAAMPEAEYARRAESTYATLLPKLAGPPFYAEAYRRLAE
jgi:glycosyltransferase involved in cell wall biosynthesis